MKPNAKTLERHSRMLALRDFEEKDLESLMNTTITVVGAGGLGSPALRLLTSIGFGTIRIIDHDIIDLSNLQRQNIYNTDDVGKPKVDAAVANLSKQNPDVVFEPVAATMRPDNAIALLNGSDIVLDGLDSMDTRRAVNTACLYHGIPYVYAGALEYYANISTFVPGKTGCLHCLIGDMQDNPENTCVNVGVSASLLGLVASIEVREAVLLAIGKQPRLAGRLMHIDIESLGFDSFEILKMESCPICGVKAPEPEKQTEISVTMLCSESFSVSPPERLNLDLDEISNRCSSKYKVTKKLRALVLESGNIRVTLMSRGNAVVKGLKDSAEVVTYYREIVNL